MPDLSPLLRFTAEDVAAAHAKWGYNCGPVALAAVLGMTLDELRRNLDPDGFRGYMNTSMMISAICCCDAVHGKALGPWPIHGLSRIQFNGPWTALGASPKWAAKYTHWVGSKWATKGDPESVWVFDINSLWLPLAEWTEEIAPRLAASYRRADGTWSVTTAMEIRKARANHAH